MIKNDTPLTKHKMSVLLHEQSGKWNKIRKFVLTWLYWQWLYWQFKALGLVYSERQHDTMMMVAISLSLKTMESLQIGVATHSGVTPLFSMRTVSLASSQHCRCVDADAQSKWALTVKWSFSPSSNLFWWAPWICVVISSERLLFFLFNSGLK